MLRPLTLALLLLCANAHAQQFPYNRFSLEGQFGVNNPVNPVASGYDAPSLGLFTAGVGSRLMLNDRAGIRLSAAYNRLSSKSGTPEFRTNYYRVSFEGVINLSEMLEFYQWTDRFGFLFHAGFGYSSMKERNATIGWDQMAHAMAGFTPQFRLNHRWAVELDLTAIAHAYQTQTYDFTQRNDKRGIDGYLYNLTFGVHYYLGKQAVHADWYASPDNAGIDTASQHRLALLETQLQDADADGVPNYLDMEPNTPAGTEVDFKGRTVNALVKDSDGDNVPDAEDQCPGIKGESALRGCPDEDKDGIADHLDRCPQVPGNAKDAGCPPTASTRNSESDEVTETVQFETGKFTLTSGSYVTLDKLVQLLKDHSDYTLDITGHTDSRGGVAFNQELSEKRAAVVRDYLIKKGIAADRLSVRGKGFNDPVTLNDSENGRAMNRRVSLILK